jgi:hypothetical protein
MAVAAHHPIARMLDADPEDAPAAFMQFFGEVCSIPIVRLFGITDDAATPLAVWVRLGDDDEEQEERIYYALQAYRRSKSPPIDLRVVLASQPDDVFPQDATVLFTRQ